MQNLYDSQNDVVHAPGWAGHDYTLCGNAMEGMSIGDEVEETEKGITCPDCIAIIRHCKSLRLPRQKSLLTNTAVTPSQQ